MTDDGRNTQDEAEAGPLTGKKLDKREGVVGQTSDNDPRFDELSGDEPGEHKGQIRPKSD